MSMLHAHGIHAEEGIHRPRGSDELMPALIVSVEDYPRASALVHSVAPMLNVMANKTGKGLDPSPSPCGCFVLHRSQVPRP
jgi:hypothetical protein